MTVEVLNIKGEKTGRTLEMPADVFGIEPHQHSVYLAVKQYLAHQRQGTHKSKERSEISGSTRKLHRQKGTGGSRKGDINSPLFPGGGRVFGPKPHKYSIQLNKKVARLARRSALSAKAAAGELVVVEDFGFDVPKTSTLRQLVSGVGASKKALIVTGAEKGENVYLSGRNLDNVQVARAQDLNTYQIMNGGMIVLSESAISVIASSLS
jgi:large subunit ribosomal protein L4